MVVALQASAILTLCIYAFSIAVTDILDGGRIIDLRMAPDEDLQEEVRAIVDGVGHSYGFSGSVIRMAKVGRELAIEISLIGRGNKQIQAIEDLDLIRYSIEEKLKRFPIGQWLIIVFTASEEWA